MAKAIMVQGRKSRPSASETDRQAYAVRGLRDAGIDIFSCLRYNAFKSKL
ncbi:MAG: hypothetical protein LBK56_07275 [Gracilibacteraceae bacterium]|jgi:hypothetical protein|nr:hypothetical protein [Gracilibacteraceae bacterium]